MVADELTLFYAPATRAIRVLWLLEELAQPYRLEVVNIWKGEQNAPAFRAVNPAGKLPAIRHGSVAMGESAAICCYLADRFPGAGLAPAVDAPERGRYLQWLFFAGGNVEPAIMTHARKWEVSAFQAAWGDYAGVVENIAGAVGKDRYVLGRQFSAADIVLGSIVHYALKFDLLPKRPELTGYVDLLETRPALQRAVRIEREQEARFKR